MNGAETLGGDEPQLNLNSTHGGLYADLGSRDDWATRERQAAAHRMLTDLATQCSEAAADHIDRTIRDILADVSQMLAVDGCVAYLPDAGGGAALTATYGWRRTPGDGSCQHVPSSEQLPWITARSHDGATLRAPTLDHLPDTLDRAAMGGLGAKACASVPIGLPGQRGALIAYSSESSPWPDTAMEALRLAAAIIGLIAARRSTARSVVEMSAPASTDDTRSSDVAVVRRGAPPARGNRSTIIASSDPIKKVLDLAKQVAPTGATVLLLGETGVGKEVVAEAIHDLSPRRSRPMVKVNCAAIPATLLENELFGHERGAFTDAWARQVGRFEAAQGGTIFLDEIGELPRELQVKLLRVLQERTIERIGGGQPVKIDVRVIAATNSDLERAVRGNTFREDLFYRLNVFPIRIPPLRERVADIPSLVWAFVDELSPSLGKRIDAISKESLQELQRYAWPGNIRELRNLVEREMIQAQGSTLTINVPLAWSSPTVADPKTSHIKAVLESCGWRIRGGGGAAERLNMKPTTLESQIARLGLSRRVALSN